MTRHIGLAIMLTAIPAMAGADDSYIRLESWRDPAAASASAERWAEQFPDVVTYPAAGWHAVAIGPVEGGGAGAAERLSTLREAGTIPGDAVITVLDEAVRVQPVASDASDTDADLTVGAADGTEGTQPATAEAEAEADTDNDAAPEAARPAIPGAAASIAAITTPDADPDETSDTTSDTTPADAEGIETAQPDAVAETGNEGDEARADTPTHIRIEAYRDRAAAEAALTGWQARLPQIGLWVLDSGWHVIAAGPYAPDAAAARLAELKQQGSIPDDAYLSGEASLGAPLSPPSADAEAEAEESAAGSVTKSPAEAAAEMHIPAETPVESPVETASETEPEPLPPPVMPPLDVVQEALLWAGHYEGEIDGRPGPMTNAAIRAELDRQGIDPAQPDAEAIAMTALLAERAAWRDEIGLDRLEDSFTGISLTVPVTRLDFLRTDRNLSIYGPREGSGAALILFNQEGGRTEMHDLAGLITALGWVPNPARDIAADRFRLEGSDDLHIGHAEARITDGRVQGFVLIWPQADAENAPRLIREAAASFTLADPPAPAPESAAAD